MSSMLKTFYSRFYRQKKLIVWCDNVDESGGGDNIFEATFTWV